MAMRASGKAKSTKTSLSGSRMRYCATGSNPASRSSRSILVSSTLSCNGEPGARCSTSSRKACVPGKRRGARRESSHRSLGMVTSRRRRASSIASPTARASATVARSNSVRPAEVTGIPSSTRRSSGSSGPD